VARLTVGSVLRVKLEEADRGGNPTVSEVVELVRLAPQESVQSGPSGQVGTVTRYDHERGFGFVSVPGFQDGVFLHVSALRRAGVEAVDRGDKVMVEVRQGQRGMEVASVKMVVHAGGTVAA
jgi:CspA family cold shock protein